MLQMAFKAIKDTTSPNDLVSTLLVFGAYFYKVTNLPPSFLQQQQPYTSTITMSNLEKLKAQR